MSSDPIQTFLDECGELLAVMEDLLLNVESNADDPEAINTLFRAVHTIKGSSGVFGFEHVVHFTHRVESVMDQVRAGERALDAELAAVLLDCRDHISQLVELAAADPAAALDADLEQHGQALLTALDGGSPATAANAVTTAGVVEATRSGGGAIEGNNWHISLRFHADAFRNGIDPLSFLRYLRTVGEVRDTLTVTDRIRDAQPFDPEDCLLGFEISLQSQANKGEIEEVFAFAQDDCEIVIVPPQSNTGEYLALLDRMPEDELLRLGEMLLGAGALTQRELDQALAAQNTGDQGEGAATRPLGEILVEQNSVAQPVLDGALQKQGKVKAKLQRDAQLIRVDADKLGQLINLVGELVTASAATELLARSEGSLLLQESLAGMNKLVSEIRDNALTLRMVQIGETFSRFRRVVRDLSRELGKSIALEIDGGETELDKTVVESLSDPLMHLVRNAIDHGIEAPAVRAAAGKPERGTIQLSAYHDSGSIVITITDDGGGLNLDKLRDKAVNRGLIAADVQLSRRELMQLIFAPGLSTKDQATDLSGRGVGMDVVKRNIESARGSVEIDSELGRGTTITIRLPLTLAIIDGFLVGSGNEPYVVPLDNVVECVELQKDDWEVRSGRHYVNLRGTVLPFVRLRELFSLAPHGNAEERENLVVVRHGRELAGLVVDRLEGELQTVIKPLGEMLAGLRVVSGATVMGNGRIAMILDVEELVRAASRGTKALAPALTALQ